MHQLTINSRELSRGLTIIEVLVALALSLIVLGGVITVYLTTLTTSGDTLNSSRLNQEVSAIMNIMANDIRRAGYANALGPDWDGDAVTNYQEPDTNPFSQPNWTAIEVHNSSNVDQGPQGNGNCILYAYDANPGDADADPVDGVGDGDSNGDGSAVRENNEYFGFRLNGDEIQMRKSVKIQDGQTPNNCATDTTSGYWESLNDPDTIRVTSLTFDLSGSRCMNTLEPDNRDNNNNGTVDELAERDCYAAATNVATNATYRATYPTDAPIPVIDIRNVLITINAVIKGDEEVAIQRRQEVTVRNNMVRLVP